MLGVIMHLSFGFCIDMIKMDYTYILLSFVIWTSITHTRSCHNVDIRAACHLLGFLDSYGCE